MEGQITNSTAERVNAAVPLAIMVIVLMMVLPVPAFVLDLLISLNLVIHFTLVMNQAILGLALLAAKTESVERRFSKTSGGGSLNGLPASKLAASICSVSAGQRGSFVRTARPRRVGRPDEARCSVAGADARPLPRREPSCTTRGCRCGVGFWPCGWPALRKQG